MGLVLCRGWVLLGTGGKQPQLAWLWAATLQHPRVTTVVPRLRVPVLRRLTVPNPVGWDAGHSRVLPVPLPPGSPLQ